MIQKLQTLAAAALLTVGLAQTASAQEGENAGVWRLTCDTGVCQAFFNIANEGSEDPFIGWSILYSTDGDFYSIIIKTPTLVALPPGVRLWFPNGDFANIPFQVCDGMNCQAVAVLEDRVRKGLSGNSTAKVAFTIYGEPEPKAYEVPIDGFDEALERLKTLK